MRQLGTRWLAVVLALAMLLSLTACGGKNGLPADEQDQQETEQQAENPSSEGAQQPAGEDYDDKLVLEGPMELEYAENFSVDLYKGGYRMIRGGSNDVQFLVVPEGMSVPADLDDGVKVLQMPIDNVYSGSSGMVSLIDAIGALDHVKLVATSLDDWYIDTVTERMNDGRITYSGSIKEPDYELMTANSIQLHVDTTMIDSYPEVLEKFSELGIPSLVEDSSKESHPLGRVEWVKLFGVLFGMEDEANAYFNEQKALVEAASTDESYGKTVAFGYIKSGGDSYARNGGDYIAQMIGIAGGDYILADMEPDQGGNTKMSFEEWYAKFKDAEYLFYWNMSVKFYSIQEMIEYNPLFADFKAVQDGHVWVTSPDFTQSTAAIASIIQDMNTILSSEDGLVTTDHLIRLE